MDSSKIHYRINYGIHYGIHWAKTASDQRFFYFSYGEVDSKNKYNLARETDNLRVKPITSRVKPIRVEWKLNGNSHLYARKYIRGYFLRGIHFMALKALRL